MTIWYAHAYTYMCVCTWIVSCDNKCIWKLGDDRCQVQFPINRDFLWNSHKYGLEYHKNETLPCRPRSLVLTWSLIQRSTNLKCIWQFQYFSLHVGAAKVSKDGSDWNASFKFFPYIYHMLLYKIMCQSRILT